MNAVTKPEAPAVSNAASTSTAVSTIAVLSTAVRILKIASCPSLSGKSTLTYHIGCAVNGDGTCTDDIQFRVVDNTNIGFFSQEWLPLSVIQGEFDKIEVGKTITSFLLHALFRGRSVNTPAFLFAVLLSEGLVQRAKDSTRRYDRIDTAAFMAKVQALIASGVDLKVDESTVKNGAKPATIKAAKPAKTSAKGDVVAASPSKIGAKPASGVDIVEIVEVINAKVPASVKPAMPAAKTPKKAPAKADAQAKQ
jgi:hypothetical protein